MWKRDGEVLNVMGMYGRCVGGDEGDRKEIWFGKGMKRLYVEDERNEDFGESRGR